MSEAHLDIAINWHLDLGAESRCEACGDNYDVIAVEYNPDRDTYGTSVKVGCYGGEFLSDVSLGQVLEELDDWLHLNPGEIGRLKDALGAFHDRRHLLKGAA